MKTITFACPDKAAYLGFTSHLTHLGRDYIKVMWDASNHVVIYNAV